MNIKKYNPLQSVPKELPVKTDMDAEEGKAPVYFLYPPAEDIYNKSIETAIRPEYIIGGKENGEKPAANEQCVNPTDDSLDVPGAELDDRMEDIGSEDEENNYYSLGLDNHNDLDENKEN